MQIYNILNESESQQSGHQSFTTITILKENYDFIFVILRPYRNTDMINITVFFIKTFPQFNFKNKQKQKEEKFNGKIT